MSIIKCPNEITGLNKKWKVFLAGPIQGAPEWQSQLPELENVVWLSPRREKYPVENFNYDGQVEWETNTIRSANIVLFWIPEEDMSIAGRSYAQTTRFELGENLARGKRIIIGVNDKFPGRRYFEYKAEKYNVIGNQVFHTLEECIEALKSYIEDAEHYHKTYFTSDTHFGSERALTLSRRPFKNIEEMDWTMIERWNNVVNPSDTIWHLGDFGENWPLDYLSGNIKMVEGNYEREGKSTIDTDYLETYAKGAVLVDFPDKDGDKHAYCMSHEPLACKEAICSWNRTIRRREKRNIFGLFGHIHGRQRIKSFGMDVGVDCSNYTPVSMDEVNFYRNAVQRGFYDDNVWRQ